MNQFDILINIRQLARFSEALNVVCPQILVNYKIGPLPSAPDWYKQVLIMYKTILTVGVRQHPFVLILVSPFRFFFRYYPTHFQNLSNFFRSLWDTLNQFSNSFTNFLNIFRCCCDTSNQKGRKRKCQAGWSLSRATWMCPNR